VGRAVYQNQLETAATGIGIRSDVTKAVGRRRRLTWATSSRERRGRRRHERAGCRLLRLPPAGVARSALWGGQQVATDGVDLLA